MNQKKELLAILGLNIQKHRKAIGYTQADLALKSNLHRSYIGAVERGERNISLLRLIHIAEVLGVKADQLVLGKKSGL